MSTGTIVLASAGLSLAYCVVHRVYAAISPERNYWYKAHGDSMSGRFIVAFHVVLFVLSFLMVLIGALA